MKPVVRWRLRVRVVLMTAALAAGLALFAGLGALLRDARRGDEALAEALAATDAEWPRWRWHEMEEDRPAVPEAEDSVRLIVRLGEVRREALPVRPNPPQGEEHP